MLSASQARSFLNHFSVDQLRFMLQMKSEYVDDLTTKALYLGNLCARGDINQIKTFIRETDPEELREILNCAPDQQWNSTCLHMLMNWNTGNKALEMFELLVEHGAEYKRDGYGSFPWQHLGSLWITPVEYVQLSERNEDEFEETRSTLREMYNLDDYEESDFLFSTCNYRCEEPEPKKRVQKFEVDLAPCAANTCPHGHPVYHCGAHWNSEEAIEVFP